MRATPLRLEGATWWPEVEARFTVVGRDRRGPAWTERGRRTNAPPVPVMRSISHDVQLPPQLVCLRLHGVTPEQRRLRAQAAAYARWSRHMAREDQAYSARQAIWERLSREVDPDRKLTPQERAVLIQSAAQRVRPPQRG
jgi:hypothetical protein